MYTVPLQRRYPDRSLSRAKVAKNVIDIQMYAQPIPQTPPQELSQRTRHILRRRRCVGDRKVLREGFDENRELMVTA
jgi:hypothetical protein